MTFTSNYHPLACEFPLLLIHPISKEYCTIALVSYPKILSALEIPFSIYSATLVAELCVWLTPQLYSGNAVHIAGEMVAMTLWERSVGIPTIKYYHTFSTLGGL